MIVVIAMHSSGSSALTGLLSENGFNSGKKSDHIKVRNHNIKGFFELDIVTKINEQILTEHHASHLNPASYIHSNRKISRSLQQDIAEAANYIIEQEIEVIKDPRFCLTWPHWEPHFPDCKFAILYRDPIAIAKSLERRQNYPISAGLALWELYMKVAIENLDLSKAALVSFHDLAKAPKKVLSSLLFELKIPKSSGDFDDSLLDRNLIHQSRGDSKDWTLVSCAQKKFWEKLESKDLAKLAETDKPELATLNLLSQFVTKGYTPENGRLMDKISKTEVQQDLKMQLQKAHQELHLVLNKYHTLLDRLHRTFNSRSVTYFERLIRFLSKVSMNKRGKPEILKLRSLLERENVTKPKIKDD